MYKRYIAAGTGMLLSLAALAKVTTDYVNRSDPSGVMLTSATASAPQAQAAAAGNPATIDVDFGVSEYYPLLKSKVGLFQELAIFQDENVLQNNLSKLDELPHTSFRGLAAFKPSQLQFNKNDTVLVDGAGNSTVHTDPQMVALLNTLRAKKFLPILDIFATPKGLRPGTQPGNDTDEAAVKVPINKTWYANAIAKLVKLYAGTGNFTWEILNESNLNKYLDSAPGQNIADYTAIYKLTAPAIRAQSPDVLLAGPALASEATGQNHQDFVTGLAGAPIDYYSFHNYNSVSDGSGGNPTDDQLKKVRGAVKGGFNTVPFLITEYENYQPSDDAGKPNREKTLGAVQLLNHIEYLEQNTDVETVSWNRYMTTGDPTTAANPGGFLSYPQTPGAQAYKRAIYNAYKVFGWLPVDRNSAALSGSTVALHAMAGSDTHNAGVLIWNNATVDKTLTINLSNLPAAIAAGGTVTVYRIDPSKSSYGECGPSCEELYQGTTFNVTSANKTLTLDIPPVGIIYLKINDASGIALQNRDGLDSANFIRSYVWAPRTGSGTNWASEGSYGSFDYKTWILRVGINATDGRGIAGTMFSAAPTNLYVRYRSKNVNVQAGTEALAALRVDYWNGSSWAKSVLYYGNTANLSRTRVLPWGKGGATGDTRISVGASIGNNQEFVVPVDANAPPNWAAAGRRVLVTAWTERMGIKSQSVVTLADHAGG